jgi:hypothetical protein
MVWPDRSSRRIRFSIACPALREAGVIAAIAAGVAQSAAAGSHPELRAAAVGRCEAIDPGESQSGLFFNPDGYRSYYARSLCFQQAAVAFRDPALCRRVKRRLSLFSSSWGYSKRNCEKLVGEGVRADREEIRAMKRGYAERHVRLVDFRVELDGNGRDYDIVPRFEGADGHAYTLTIEALPTGSAPVQLHESGYYLEGASDSVRIYLQAGEIRARFPAFDPTEPYTLRATLEYAIGSGGENGHWSEAFIESEFPAAARRESLQRVSAFGAPRAPRRGHRGDGWRGQPHDGP